MERNKHPYAPLRKTIWDDFSAISMLDYLSILSTLLILFFTVCHQ